MRAATPATSGVEKLALDIGVVWRPGDGLARVPETIRRCCDPGRLGAEMSMLVL
jgi:hypothetical protein